MEATDGDGTDATSIVSEFSTFHAMADDGYGMIEACIIITISFREDEELETVTSSLFVSAASSHTSPR